MSALHETSDSAYPPPSFRESRREVLIDAVTDMVFGHLITAGPDGPQACGAPFVIREIGEAVFLEAHLARANPQSRAGAASALVLFQGPHAYVRPAWYPTKARNGRAVPTWNYISVQARGPLEIIEDEALLRRHLEALTAQQERPFADRWSPADPPPGYVDALAKGIVAIRVGPVSLAGVWKLNQNHPQENRAGVIAGLRASRLDGAAQVADAMAKREAKVGGGAT